MLHCCGRPRTAFAGKTASSNFPPRPLWSLTPGCLASCKCSPKRVSCHFSVLYLIEKLTNNFLAEGFDKYLIAPLRTFYTIIKSPGFRVIYNQLRMKRMQFLSPTKDFVLTKYIGRKNIRNRMCHPWTRFVWRFKWLSDCNKSSPERTNSRPSTTIMTKRFGLHQKAKTSRWAEQIPGHYMPIWQQWEGCAFVGNLRCLCSAELGLRQGTRSWKKRARYRCHVMITNDTLLNNRLPFPIGGWENFHFYG